MKKLYQQTPWKFIFLLLPAFAFFGKVQAQTQVAFADPAVISLDITNMSDVSVNANLLNNNTTYKVKFGILNNNLGTVIPSGTVTVIIGLGAGLIVDGPPYNIANAPLNNYFTWSVSGSPQQITGVLHTALPVGFADILSFQVKTTTENSFVATGNFLASNGNPNYIFIDQNPNNNNVPLSYTIVAQGVLPVKLTSFTAARKDCDINAEWHVEKEMDFDRYELQVSKDGQNFVTVATVKGVNKAIYNASFPITAQLQSNNLQVRLKMIDLDGTFEYTKQVSLNSNCNEAKKLAIHGYPNPVERSGFMTVAAKEGSFKGRYVLTLVDNSGKVFGTTQLNMENIQSFRYDLPPVLAAGKYMLKVQNANGTENEVIEFQKL